MNTKFKLADTVYIIANSIFIKEAKVIKIAVSTKTYTLKFTNEQGGVRLRESRLYGTKKEAETIVNKYLKHIPPTKLLFCFTKRLYKISIFTLINHFATKYFYIFNTKLSFEMLHPFLHFVFQ